MEHPYWTDAISMNEVASLLKLSSQHVRNHYIDMGIPHERFCGRIIFRTSEVEAWVKAEEKRKQRWEERAAASFKSYDERAATARGQK